MACPIIQESHAEDMKPLQIHVKLSNIGVQITLYVNTTDTVRDVKAKIHTLAGIPIERIDLIYNGNELWNGQTLSHYNITGDAAFSLCAIFPVEDAVFPLTVCIGKERRLVEIKVKPWYDVGNLKDKIENMMGIPCDRQRIYLDGMKLENDGKLQAGLILAMYYGIRLQVEYQGGSYPSEIVLEMDESDTIADVRKIVQEKKETTWVHLGLSRFCKDGKELKESEILSDCIIGSEGRLSLPRVTVWNYFGF